MKFYFPVLFVLSASGLQAQNVAPDGTPSEPRERKTSVQLQLGTQGIGGGFRYAPSQKIALRLGVGIIPIEVKTAYNLSVFSADYTARVRSTNLHLLAEYTPFKNARGLRLIGGAAYFLNAAGTVDVKPNGRYYYGEIPMSDGQVGTLNAKVNWQGVAPYLGIGLWRGIPKRRFNVNLELGTYYMPKPQVTINATGVLKGNETQQGQIEKNMAEYRWLPVLQLNFNLKL